MDFFNQRIDDTVINTLKLVQIKVVRLPYTEAVEILQNSGQQFEYAVEWGRDLQSEHERFLTEQHFDGPVIVYDYYRTIKPFYMRVNDDENSTCDGRAGTQSRRIIGGSQREERLDVLESRMKERIWSRKAIGGIWICDDTEPCHMQDLVSDWNGPFSLLPVWPISGMLFRFHVRPAQRTFRAQCNVGLIEAAVDLSYSLS